MVEAERRRDAEVENVNLDQQGSAAKDFDVEGGQLARQDAARNSGESPGHPQHESHDDGAKGDQQRVVKPHEKQLPVLPWYTPVPGILDPGKEQIKTHTQAEPEEKPNNQAIDHQAIREEVRGNISDTVPDSAHRP